MEFNPDIDLDIEAIDEKYDKKISVERYINYIIFKVADVLTDTNLESGMVRASNLILLLETLAISDFKIQKDYYDKIKEYEEMYKNVKNGFYLVALKKLELIMSYFSLRKPVFKGVKLKNEKFFE